jgi:hypothetical protein
MVPFDPGTFVCRCGFSGRLSQEVIDGVQAMLDAEMN